MDWWIGGLVDWWVCYVGLVCIVGCTYLFVRRRAHVVLFHLPIQRRDDQWHRLEVVPSLLKAVYPVEGMA